MLFGILSNLSEDVRDTDEKTIAILASVILNKVINILYISGMLVTVSFSPTEAMDR